MGGYDHMVARPQFQQRPLPLESQDRSAAEHHDPLVPVLIVPESPGRGVTVGDDPLDTDARVLEQGLDPFVGPMCRD